MTGSGKKHDSGRSLLKGIIIARFERVLPEHSCVVGYVTTVTVRKGLLFPAS